VKATIDAASLRAAAEWAGKHTGAALPILSAVRITADAVTVTFAATDYDTWAEDVREAHVVTAGTVAVSGRLLRAVAAALPEGRVDLDADTARLNVTAGRSFRAHLPVMAAEDWPVPAPAPAADLPMPAGLGRLLAAAAGPAEGMEEQTNRSKSGCELGMSAAGLTLAAGDRYRIFASRLPWPEGTTAPERVVPLPASAVAAFADLGEGDDLRIGLPDADGSVIAAASGTRTLACRTAGHPMVAWAKLIPTTSTRSLVCDVAELVGLVKRVAPTFDSRENAKEKILTVTVGGGLFGLATDSASDAIEVEHTEEWDTDPWKVGIKAPYLLSVVEAADADRIRIDFTKPNAAWRITRPGSDAYRAIVMPVRL
jgi:DNA polymerase III sliding clamp (beta) subunit (PCNA family)